MLLENDLIDKKLKAKNSVQTSKNNDHKGLEDYMKFLNNKYKISEIKRIIRDFSARH